MRFLAFVTAAVLLQVPGWQPSFEQVQPELFGAAGGQANAWADADNDGDLDYFVAFRGRANRLYRNDQGTFRDVAAEVGLADTIETRAAAWGDFDGDGDADLFVGFADPKAAAKVYRNDSRGARFVDVAKEIGVNLNGVARQPAWIDYDGDGDLDLFAAFRDVKNRLLRNDRGQFTDVTDAAGIGDPRKTVSAVWCDFDRDGDLDLFTANQEGEANGLYRQHQGKFEDVAAAAAVAATPRPAADGGVGPSVADFDRDGDFDLFVANYGPSALYRNDGGLKFTDVARERGIDLNGHGVTSGWGDLDNDGLPDLYVGNFIAGQPLYRDALFINAAVRFVDALPAAIQRHDATHGVQFVDFDQDGRLDLALTNNDPQGGGHPLWRNTSRMRGRSIAVEVTDPNARRSRAGSEVRAYRAGTRQLLASALVDSGSGYCSQNEMPVHLGIGDDWKGNVDIEVITLLANARHASIVRNVNPDDYRGRSLRIITTR
ncbi:MAG TPA: CRTAC1 family protein [Vicinamibacterales bacterium]